MQQDYVSGIFVNDTLLDAGDATISLARSGMSDINLCSDMLEPAATFPGRELSLFFRSRAARLRRFSAQPRLQIPALR